MKLYYARSVCSFAVRIVLHQLSIPFESEAVDLKSKITETGENYLTINPKGSVPALKIREDFLLTENAIILQYLADSANAIQLLPPVNDINRYRTLEWLNFVSTDLHRYCSPLFWSKIPEDVKLTVFKPALEKRLLLVNHHLEHNQFLMGDAVTIADSYLFVILIWLEKIKFNMNEFSHLIRYAATMRKIEAVTKSLAEENLQ